MNTKPTRKANRIWKIFAALFLALWIVSSTNVTSISASDSDLPDTISYDDVIRQDMHNIAYLYAHHHWAASERNLITYYSNYAYPDTYLNRFETTYPYTGDPNNPLFRSNHLLEPNSNNDKYFDNTNGLFLTRGFMDDAPVNTPAWIVPDTLLFPVEPEFYTEFLAGLNSGSVTDAIAQRFADHQKTITVGLPIEPDYVGSKWIIIDSNLHRYHVRNIFGTIYVYDGFLNEGVPYAWGLAHNVSATSYDMAVNPQIVDVDIPRGDGNQIFDQKIGYGHFAGNVWTDDPDPNRVNNYAAGVDCVGLINNVWRMGARTDADHVALASMPIEFKNLKMGDILIDTEKHVMMFDEFVEYHPSQSDPGVGTIFSVYEASDVAGKVTNTYYTVATIDPANGYYNGRNDYLTNTVTLRRNEDNVLLVGKIFTPRTYYSLAPVDVALVIDKSGSMSGEKLRQTKLAAQYFVSQMKPGDKISVVAFNDTAQIPQVYPLTEIDTEGVVQNAARQAIGGITASGGTSIGAGLSQGVSSVNINYPDMPHIPVIILFSDGYNTVGAEYDDVKDDIKAAGIAVHTLGIGDGANEALLQQIARENGGEFQWIRVPNRMRFMVNAIYEKIYGVNTPVQTTPSATIAAGGTVTQNLPVDSAMGSMTISFFTSDSGINLTLTQPDGSPVDLDSPSVTHTVGEGYETYTILAPQTGTWTTSVSSSIAGEYALSVSTMDAMTVSVATDKDEYVAGDPIVFTASVNDSTSGSLLAPPNYILGATIQVTAEDPARQQATFELYDDGQHDDGEENDGIYANTFSNTSLAGVYNFKIQISGNNNRDGQPFTREEALPVVVLAPPNVVSSLRASVNPTNYHSVDYTVTFSEPVTGVDASDFVLTTSGLSGAEVSVVSGSDSEYTVTVAAGDGVGTLRLDVVDDDTIVDGDGIPLGRAGIGNGDFSTGETYTIDRTAPASVVTKLDDTNDGFCDADCSLREAIGAAAPGDTVAFDSALSGGVIRLASTLTLSRDITIDASALSAPVTISGDRYNDGMKHVRVFHISTGISAVLNNLVISMSLSGGIHNTGALTVENCIFLNNDRGISNVGGTLVVSNSVFSNNAATYHAGGIFNSGTATIVNSAFSGNTSTYGGGISNRGTVTIANSAFSDNASTYGGGIYNEVGSTTTIMNSTFSVNMASSHGSGIYNAGTLNYANTIIANSASGGDCYNSGAIGVNTNNLVEDGSCAAGSSGDPLLDALADNGGPTQTMALLPGSPAIDAGDDATCADAPVDGLDQRGVARPQGPHCDIGAYEAQDVTPPTVQSITLASANPTSAASVDFTVTFSEPVAGVDVSDFSLAVTGDISGASVSAAAAAGSQAVYTVTVDAGVGGGALRLDIPTTATIADLIGTPLAGLPYQSGEEYTILVTAPGKASLVSPSGDIGDNYYPAYTWQEVTEGGAESISTWYYLWVNGPSGNIIKQWYPAAEVCSSGVCSVTPSTALGGGAHTWWVQTWNSAGYGPWSDAMTFDTAVPTVPGKAVLVSPSGNAVSNTPTYTWNEVTESGAESMSTWYYLWVNGPAGNVIKQWYKAVDICDAGLCAATPATALASGAHTWWVQTWNPAGYGPWSDAMTFNTAIPAMTVTPSATATDTPTPVETPSATIIVDEFEESLLDPDWEWYLPAAGPEYSLDADPGYLQLVIPSGFDHWSDQDYAPQVRRDDMGDGDWAIETWLALDDTNAGDAWQVNLLAGFDRYDQQWLSIASDDTLRVTRVGGDDTAFVAEISLPLYLRIEKTGNEYTFKYKEPDGEQWQVLGSQSIETPVKNVGLQFRTFYTSSGDAVFDVDYFRLERLGSLAPEPEKEIDVDEFDDASLASGWEWYAPLEGPTYSSNNGLFSMYLPAFSGFEHWVDVDNAPQLRRTDLGEGNWAIETQLEAINAAPDAAYWVALEAGFDQYDQLWFGMLDNGSLGAIRVGEGGSFIEKPESMPIILRLEKEGESYIFKCRHDPDEAWTILAAREYAGTPQYVGLLGRGFITGSDDLTIDWSYFQLERWASAGARMTPQSLHGAQGKIAATLGKGQTPAALGTPSRQPTSAASPTATVTPTPPRTPTPTLTPTEAEEE